MKKETHGAVISRFMEINNISVAKFAEIIGREPQTIYAWRTKQKLKDELIALITLHFDIAPSEFGITFNLKYKNVGKSSNTLRFYEDSDDDIKLLDYFGSLIDVVETTQDTLNIYDYFGKMNNDTLRVQESFHKYQEEYLLAIEKHIFESENFKSYNRTIALALRKNHYYQMEKCLEQAIELMFLVTFKHIWRCLFHQDRFNLFITEAPIKSYSFAYIDDTYGISEYDKYDVDGNPKPNMLFITKNKKGRSSEQIINSYRREYGKIIRDGNNFHYPTWKIDKDTFLHCLQRKLYETGNALKKLRSEVNDHNEWLQENLSKPLKDRIGSEGSRNFESPNKYQETEKLHKNLRRKYDYTLEYTKRT